MKVSNFKREKRKYTWK